MINGGKEILGPIVNVTPEAGQSAEFVLENSGETGYSAADGASRAHRAGGYGFTVVSNEIPEIALSGFELTFWGVPADPSHDPMRGRSTARKPNTERLVGLPGWW